MIELWSPNSKAFNRKQPEYVSGDCTLVKRDSEKHKMLLQLGWLTTQEHKSRLSAVKPGD